MEEYRVTNNEKRQRYEVHVNDEVAYLEYKFYKGDIALMHTWVPPVLEGKGIASALAKFALEEAREKKQPVMVYCPFVSSFLKRHPDYNDVLDKQYRR